MKRLIIAAFCCALLNNVNAQTDKEPVANATNDDNIFTPPAFFETYQLKKGETNNQLHVYNNFANDAKYQRVVDIRWTFKSEADALKWHQMNLATNSEGGAPIKDEILIRGAKDVRAFREGASTTEMMKSLGINQRHHYFIFVYKNIVCKVFIATDEKTNTMDVVPFAIAAASQLEAVLK